MSAARVPRPSLEAVEDRVLRAGGRLKRVPCCSASGAFGSRVPTHQRLPTRFLGLWCRCAHSRAGVVAELVASFTALTRGIGYVFGTHRPLLAMATLLKVVNIDSVEGLSYIGIVSLSGPRLDDDGDECDIASTP